MFRRLSGNAEPPYRFVTCACPFAAVRIGASAAGKARFSAAEAPQSGRRANSGRWPAIQRSANPARKSATQAGSLLGSRAVLQGVEQCGHGTQVALFRLILVRCERWLKVRHERSYCMKRSSDKREYQKPFGETEAERSIVTAKVARVLRRNAVMLTLLIENSPLRRGLRPAWRHPSSGEGLALLKRVIPPASVM
jgi:hypothetical protein